jgi:hypothetical protein
MSQNTTTTTTFYITPNGAGGLEVLTYSTGNKEQVPHTYTSGSGIKPHRIEWNYSEETHVSELTKIQWEKLHANNGKFLSFRPWMGSRKNRFVDNIEKPSETSVQLPETISTMPEIHNDRIYENIDVNVHTMMEFGGGNLHDLVPIKTGKYYDQFISTRNGLIPGSQYFVTGEPGVGKSSVLMDYLNSVVQFDPTKRVLYMSGEMDRYDVQEIQQYYKNSDRNISMTFMRDWIKNKQSVWHSLIATLKQGWDVVAIDSLLVYQEIIQEELGCSYKKAESKILEVLMQASEGINDTGVKTSFFSIQQKNKGGQYVGSKKLEHMMTGFLKLRKDKKENKVFMEFSKNRKNAKMINVPLYYRFTDGGGIALDSERLEHYLGLNQLLSSPDENGTASKMKLEEFVKLVSSSKKEKNDNEDIPPILVG